MQPLSERTRRLYLALFIGLFFSILPAVIFYADGWRWDRTIGLYKTGGIFVAVPYPDADVVIDGEHVGRSGFFDRSFYVGDLAPAAYQVEVSRDGYLAWSKVAVVEPQLVTDVEALLFPKRVERIRLAVTGTATTGVTVIPRALYDDYLDAFEETASSTAPQDESNGIGLYIRGGDLLVRWTQDDALPPSRFCGRPSFCVHEFALERGTETARTARFFRGGVVYATEEGIYFSEADVRPATVMAQLFDEAGADFRVIDDALIVRSGTTLYELEL